MTGEGAVQGKVVGIIYPPPDLRGIVDKTAQFVAKNGKEFEVRIMGSEAGNQKFSFLRENDPYHAYYDFKVKEFQDAIGVCVCVCV
jgi:splicing factor 3A subunit 1